MSELDLDEQEFAPVHVVQLQLCDPCIDGEGDECHTPGCSLWLNRPPDIGLRDNPSVTIAAAAEPQPAPAPAAAMAEHAELEDAYAAAHGRVAELEGELAALRGLLDEIGVMAANAPEDGDSFGLLEQIAMRIAAIDVPDTTPLGEWPDPGNPVTGRTAGAAAPELAAASIESEADEMRAVIDMIWRMCQRAERAAGTSQGADIGGEHLAARIASLIKNSEMEPF